jgi:predicted dinucleotide-binding enzyme
MKIGIIGSGIVARTLASGFVDHEHEVVIGTRHAANLKEWATQNPKVQVADFAEAARFGDLLVLAVKGAAASEALRLAGGNGIGSKPVIDACNPIADAPPENGVLKFSTNLDDSLMEQLQREFPTLQFVKAFNSVGANCMVHPSFAGGMPTMFICGNDAGAKETVTRLIEQLGWEIEDMGSVEAARTIEPLCILWCIPGFARNDWNHAFKMLR